MYGKNYKVVSSELQGVVPTGGEYPTYPVEQVNGGITYTTTTTTTGGRLTGLTSVTGITGVTGVQAWNQQQQQTGLVGGCQGIEGVQQYGKQQQQTSLVGGCQGIEGVQQYGKQQQQTGLVGGCQGAEGVQQYGKQQQQTGLVGGCQGVEGVQQYGQQQQQQGVRGLWEQPEIVGELAKLPRVLPFYAKTRQGLEQIMQYVEQNPTDLSIHCLLNAHSTYTPKVYPYRGFTLVNGEQRLRQIEQVEQLEQRPVWFLFSGMGIEQWSCGVLREMMKLDSFRRSVLRSCEILRPYGIQLLQWINGQQQQQQQQPMNGVESFVYLTAVQIALADCLRQIGVRPEGLIGQSIGELVCAYVDQCLTHEQALMSSYYLAKCVQQAQNLPKSLMAVVGDLTWEQLKSRCPSGVVPVCHESADQFLITGPIQQVRDLLRQLRLEGIYVREIELPTQAGCGIENFGLIHSQYLSEIVPVLRQYLECLNIVPKQRTSRWVSSSVPEHKWNTQIGQNFNVEYLLNLLTSPVMLHQTFRQVPRNAIIVEISPRSFVQSLLKKHFVQPSTYGLNCGVNGGLNGGLNGGVYGGVSQVYGVPTIVSLLPTVYGGIETPNHLEHFLAQLGRLYLEGVEFDSVKLFVPVHLERTAYPVPVEQQVLGLFSQWNIQPEPLSFYVQGQQQQQQQYQPRFGGVQSIVDELVLNGLNGLNISDVETFRFTVDVESLLEKESYLLNHQINGRVLYPTTGYLYLVWKSLAQLQRQQQQQQGQRQTFVQPIHLDSVFGQPCEVEQLPPVCFENVQIHRATVLREQPQQIVIVPQNRRVLFQINIQPSTGSFEIVEGKNLIVNGRVYVPTGLEMNEFVTPFKSQWESEVRCNMVMPQEEIYRKFRQCGYEYNGEFQPIVRSNVLGTQGELMWTGKWIPFLDAMLQMNYLAQQQQQQQQGVEQSSGLMLPTRIRSVRINPIEHLIRADRYVTLPVVHDLYTNKTQCGSIEITGLQVTPVVLPRGQFYPTIATETTPTGITGVQSSTTVQTTVTITGTQQQQQQPRQPTTQFGGRYVCVEGEQVPFVGGQWYQTIVGGEQQQQQQQQRVGRIVSLGQWGVEQQSQSTGEQQGQWTGEQQGQWTGEQQGQWTGEQQQGVQQPFGGKWSVLGGLQQTVGLFNPRLTHVVVGGLDCEFGLELAQWMVQYGGARYLVLTTQRVNGGESTLNGQQVQKLRYLQNEYGCQIKIVSTLDLSDETECLLLVRQACRMTSHFEGRIGSVFHLGGLFVEQPTTGSVSIKSLYHLDKHTRCSTVMPEYGLFVAFTRSGFNGLTQTGLQTVIEGVCESRRRECGKHGLVVDWNLLFNGVEYPQQPTGIQYQQGLTRFEQLLLKSIRVQLPVEYQQQYEQLPIESCFGGEFPFWGQQFPLRRLVGGRSNEVEFFYGQQQQGQQQQGRQFCLMPSRVVEKLNNVEFVYGQQSQQQPLFVVLPIEGQVHLIKSWAQQLRVPVYGLHYTQECLKFETVEQLAQFYWQQIEKVFPQLEKFHLVGHTFGVPVAFEMASRRPQQVLSLCLLDSGLTQSFLNGGVYGTVVSESEALYKFYQQFVAPSCRLGSEQFYQYLSQLPSFDERVRYVVGKIVEQCQYNFDLVDLEQGVRSFVQKMIMSCRYVPTQPLRLNRILVVRPTVQPLSGRYQQQSEYVYGQQQQQQQELFEQELVEKVFQGLRQYVFGKLQVHLVDADQRSFLQGETGCRVASVLNQHLFGEY